MKKIISALAIIITAAFLATAFSGPVWAAVSGPCANCHTMHNSDDGGSMVAGGGDAQPHLLTNTCVGCHSAASGWKSAIGAPIVYNTSEPTYPDETLAGGNFYWVENVGDAKGHNVFEANPDNALAEAPGTMGFCSGDGLCHINLHEPYAGTGYPGLTGRQGCIKCHMVNDQLPHNPGGNTVVEHYHHGDDSDTVIDEPPYFRFLGGGHMTGAGAAHGVHGIENSDWNHGADADNHNEYKGYNNPAWGALGTNGHMSGFCWACHSDFHEQEDTGKWVRHPADAVIPNSGEYASAFGGTYDPQVPVARPSLSTVSGSVTPGTDMVMCLSCHRAHGSPYDDMLRWDYNGMVSGTTGAAAGTGCFQCHTEKDGV